MKKEKKFDLSLAIILIAAFVLWTAAVCIIDVKPVGPLESEIGMALINIFFHELTGVNMSLYVLTDWLGLVPICIAAGFALSGLKQWIGRKSILKVDRNLFVLGGFYVVVMTVFVFFEIFVINYRPVLIEGMLEASYPSSTTMLTLCVMPTAVMQLKERIKNIKIKRCIVAVMEFFTVSMVVLRFVSGVHWFSDIIGGILISSGFVMLYKAVVNADI